MAGPDRFGGIEMRPQMPCAHFALIERPEMRHQCAPSHPVAPAALGALAAAARRQA